MGAVSYGKSRRKAPRLVNLVSPTGARITVTEERAAVLLERAPIDLPEGETARYEYDDSDELSSVEASEERAAKRNGRSERTGVDLKKDGNK